MVSLTEKGRRLIETDDSNQALVKRIYTQPQFQKQLVIAASQLYHQWVKTNSLPPITPADPARNREIFRQTIYRCNVHWLDMYLNENALDFMIDSFDKKSVKEIKVLTGLYDNEFSTKLAFSTESFDLPKVEYEMMKEA